MTAQEVADLKDQVARLQAQISSAAKDLSLVNIIPKWSGSSQSGSLSDFINSVERAADSGNWSDQDRVSLAIMKLEDSARLFVEAAPELKKKDLKWTELKAAL